ncbi:MAG: ComEC/Rec2 family competence protein [Puniceicoccales bacterium]|jgi:ComEC/Rec2-related protein|nr:ComEC/Rec2 family competence protein [Puniceicoccales bacterium]
MAVFLPLMVGTLLGKVVGGLTLVIVIGILCIGTCFCYFFSRQKRLLGHCFFICFAAIYAFWRFETAVSIDREQIWRLTYEVEIEKIDHKSERAKVYGYGKITKVHSEKYRMLEGHRIYFYLNGDKDYISSQILKLRSGVRSLEPATAEPFFSYLTQKNIYLYGYRGKVLEIVKAENIFRHFFAEINRMLHDQMERYIQRYGSHPADGILYGILLSEKKELSKKQKASFHHTSAAHLLAVSGLHIGIIGFALDLLLRCFFLKKSWRRWSIIGILLPYVGAIGFPPSAARAWLMLVCFWSAGFCSRKSLGLSPLLLAAILALLYDPLLLFDIGFQLSYGVAAMLLLLSVPLRKIILWLFDKMRCNIFPEAKGRKMGPVSWKVAKLLSVSTAATLASAPLTFEYFNMFSLTGIILNPIVIQMALPIVVCGFLFLLLGILRLEGVVGNILFALARMGASLIDDLLSLSEQYVPWYIEFPTKPNGMGLCFFAIITAIALKIYEIHKNLQWQRIRRMNL